MCLPCLPGGLQDQSIKLKEEYHRFRNRSGEGGSRERSAHAAICWCLRPSLARSGGVLRCISVFDTTPACLPAPPAAYSMVAIAGTLLVGMMRAKAVAEAHEQFTLTPLLIGARCGSCRGWGAHAWAARGRQAQARLRGMPPPAPPRPPCLCSRLPALPLLAPLLLHRLGDARERAQGQRQPHPPLVSPRGCRLTAARWHRLGCP